MIRTATRSVLRSSPLQQSQRRLITSSPVTKDAASSAKDAAASAKKSAEGASKQFANYAEKAKQAAGPLGQRLQGALGGVYKSAYSWKEARMLTSSLASPPGYADPLIYNAKVAGHVAKQVYIAESLAPPKSFAAVQEAYQTMYNRAKDASFWQRLVQTGEWKKFAIYAVEAYGIWTIGEMVSARASGKGPNCA